MDQKPQHNPALRFILLLLILIFCWLLGRYFQFDGASLRTSLAQYSIILSGVIFIFLYVLTTTFIWFGPKDIFRIAGAILFGAVASTLFVWIAEMGNTAIMFLLSRRLGREFIEQKYKLKAEAIDQVKKDSSVLGLVALRINPLIPFRLMDLGFGLSAISLKKYWMVTLIASIPRIFWLQVIIASIGEGIYKEPSEVISYLIEHKSMVVQSGYYFALVGGLSIMAIVAKWTKRKGEVCTK